MRGVQPDGTAGVAPRVCRPARPGPRNVTLSTIAGCLPGSTPQPAAIAVIGACGFIGANIVLYLARRGHRVIACDVNLPPEPLRRASANRQGQVAWLALDVSDEQAWSTLDTEPAERIIHGAAVTPGGTDPDPARTARVNLWGTIDGLEYARRRGCRRFVFVSSGAVYGPTRASRPLRETRAPKSPTSYAHSKLSAERFVSLYRRSYGLDACSVRLAAAYGPWERPTGARTRMSAIYLLAQAALRHERLRVAGERIARDWTYAEDIAAGLAHLAYLPAVPFDLFNLSYGNPITLGEIVRHLRRLVPEAVIETSTPRKAGLALGPADQRAPLDVARLAQTGFTASTGPEVGLTRYLDWLRSEGNFLLKTPSESSA